MIAPLESDPEIHQLVLEHFVCVRFQGDGGILGPEGPFRFEYPLPFYLLVKDATGRDLTEQRGMFPEATPEQERDQLLAHVLKCLDQNGPAIVPAERAKLSKKLEELLKRLDEKEYAEAGRLLLKLEAHPYILKCAEMGWSPEAFQAVREARTRFDEMAQAALTEAKASPPEKARRAFQEIAKSFRACPEVLAEAESQLSEARKRPDNGPTWDRGSGLTSPDATP